MIQTDLYSFSYKIGALAPWCKRCGDTRFYKDGKNEHVKQLYKCKSCKFRFIWTSDLPRRNFFSNIISLAKEIYITTGISLRELAKKLKKFFNIKISHEGIRKWLLISENTISPREIVVSSTWHVDETYIKIKGNGFWLWIVYCKENKQVLAWHISKRRTIKDAKIVLKKALDLVKIKPEKIITDGLLQYVTAIKKVIGWNYRVQKENHIIDSGFGLNAILERVNREVKRRIKWFNTFQSIEGANVFFNLFFYHFNRRD